MHSHRNATSRIAKGSQLVLKSINTVKVFSIVYVPVYLGKALSLWGYKAFYKTRNGSCVSAQRAKAERKACEERGERGEPRAPCLGMWSCGHRL